MKHLRANAPKDYLRFFSNLALTGVISATTFTALGFPIVLGVAAAGITAGTQLGLTPLLKQGLQEAIDHEKGMVQAKEDRANLTKTIGKWVEEFSQKFNLKTPPQVLIMPEKAKSGKVSDDSLKGSLRNFLRKEFNKQANAFAFTHDKDNIVLTDPIVKSLDEDELKGVVAHEMGHIVAKHVDGSMIMRYISTPAKIAAGLSFIFTTFSSFKNIGLFLVANSFANMASNSYGKFWDLDPEKPLHKKSLQSVRYYAFHGSLAAMGLAFGAPELLIAQGINVATNRSFDLVEKFHSRVNEFRADRLAVEMTKDKVSLATGLEKVKAHHMKELDPEGKIIKENQERTTLGAIFERVRDLSKTHPNVDRRKERISEIQLPDFAKWFIPNYV